MTSPEQLPPTFELPADAQWRMRQRLLNKVASGDITSRSRHRAWMAPAAVAASVLLAAGGFTAIRALTGSDSPAPNGAFGPAGSADPTTGMTTPGTSAASVVDGIDCGTFALAQGEQLPESAVRCLTAAATAGEPARLQQTKPSAEGDPVVTTYTVDGRGRIRVVIDTRADPNATGEVHRQTCTGLTQVDGRLVTHGCTESPAGSN